MRNSTRLVRGGQTTQHWFRMAGQIVLTLSICCILTFGVCYSALVWYFFDVTDLRIAVSYFQADIFANALNRPTHTFTILNLEGVTQTLTAHALATDPAITAFIEQNSVTHRWIFWTSMIPAAFAGVFVLFIYARQGQELGKTKHERGTQLIEQSELNRWSEDKWAKFESEFGKDAGGPRYTMAGIKFPPNAVPAQTGIFGTVGVGKTTAMIELLERIREQGGRAIVYDRMGSLVEKFYDPLKGDKIINPFDRRSVSWSPFGEADDVASFAQMAEVLIPAKADAPDPFWSMSARIVFEFAARKLMEKNEGTNANLRDAISVIPDEELIDLVEQTPAARMMSRDNPKTAANIRSNLIQELRFFEFLRDDAEPFSIRDWVKTDKPGVIFLTGDSEHSAATRNIISACFEIAANALMTCGQAREPKLWFFLDEVPTLNRLPFLESKLAEIRQFGGAFVLGYQVYAQLVSVYGIAGAEAISGVLNNRLVFNSPDADTAERFSKSLGSEDIIDQRHNLTMGAHSTRDGVGFSEQRVERRIVTPSQIQSLPQLVAYLRFAYDAPTAKVAFNYISRPSIAPAFLEYEGDAFNTASKSTTPQYLGKLGILRRNALHFHEAHEWLPLFNAWKDARHTKALEDYQTSIRIGAEQPLDLTFAPFDPEFRKMASEDASASWHDELNLWRHFWRKWNLGFEPKAIGKINLYDRYTREELEDLEIAVPPFPHLKTWLTPEEVEAEAKRAALWGQASDAVVETKAVEDADAEAKNTAVDQAIAAGKPGLAARAMPVGPREQSPVTSERATFVAAQSPIGVANATDGVEPATTPNAGAHLSVVSQDASPSGNGAQGIPPSEAAPSLRVVEDQTESMGPQTVEPEPAVLFPDEAEAEGTTGESTAQTTTPYETPQSIDLDALVNLSDMLKS